MHLCPCTKLRRLSLLPPRSTKSSEQRRGLLGKPARQRSPLRHARIGRAIHRPLELTTKRPVNLSNSKYPCFKKFTGRFKYRYNRFNKSVIAHHPIPSLNILAIVQRIERMPPKRKIQVRFLLAGPSSTSGRLKTQSFFRRPDFLFSPRPSGTLHTDIDIDLPQTCCKKLHIKSMFRLSCRRENIPKENAT